MIQCCKMRHIIIIMENDLQEAKLQNDKQTIQQINKELYSMRIKLRERIKMLNK